MTFVAVCRLTVVVCQALMSISLDISSKLWEVVRRRARRTAAGIGNEETVLLSIDTCRFRRHG